MTSQVDYQRESDLINKARDIAGTLFSNNGNLESAIKTTLIELSDCLSQRVVYIYESRKYMAVANYLDNYVL